MTPAFGAVGAGLQLGFATAPLGREPFVVLHEGRHGRVLLGELRSGDAVVARFAWKHRSEIAATAGRPLANAVVDAQWQRERALVLAGGNGVVPAFPLPAAALQSPPLWYCARTARYFHPVCPDTGAALRTCRDDAVLAAAGLPAYATDRERFVHAVAPGAPAVLWQLEPTSRRRGAFEVRGREQLIGGYAALVHAPAGEARVALAATMLPCLSCAHRLQCFPDGVPAAALPAQQELHVVSFHDVDAVATELQPFDFDECAALLGGGAIDDVLGPRSQLGRDVAIPAAVRAALRDGPQWWFADEPVRFLHEVALRKLDAFRGLLDGLATVHASGRPHLGLVPGNVLGAFAASTPARHGLQLRLHDLASAMVKALPGDAEALLESGPECFADLGNRAFLAPELRESDGPTLPMTVSCYRAGEQGGASRFVVEAQGGGVSRAARPGDVLVVQPTGGGASLVARLDEPRAKGLLASAALPEGHPCLSWDGHTFEARMAFHRRLDASADAHAIGALLLRLLLVDDETAVDDVFAAWERCMRWLGDESGVARGDARGLAARLQPMLMGRDTRRFLQPLRLLHRRVDRDAYEQAVADGREPFAPELWSELLAIVARLQGHALPTRLARGSADERPWLEVLRAELDTVRGRLQVELFDAGARDAMVGEVARRWLAHCEATPVAAAKQAVTTPAVAFSLRIEAAGVEPRTLEYPGDRVTIGRRDDNVLQLADPMVSSAHAAIERDGDGFVVVDRASTNGTEVDGIRLPVEVPQPLQDGSVIGIRPFTLTFRLAKDDLEATMVSGGGTDVPLREQLRSAWAAAPHDALAREQALYDVLNGALQARGSRALAEALRALLPAEASDPVAEARQAIAAAAAHGLAQLSRALLGAGEFRTAADAQAFAARVARFVEASTQGIERLLALRKALGRHLDLGLLATQSGVPVLRTAADVRQLVLGWEAGGPTAEAAGQFVVRFYDDLLAILGGLLRGNQQVRRAVRERLDPAQLVAAASREAKLSLLVNAAAGSALWKLYVQTFREVTGDEQYERDLEQLLQQALPDRPDGAGA